MSTETKTLATKDQSIKQLISSPQYREQFAAALPRHLSVDRFVRTLQTALLRNPELANCDKASFFLAALNISALGLEADGRRAHLIPFKNNKKGITEVQLIIDYKGLAELVRRSGDVSDLHADVICENDEFSFSFGTGSHLKHRPALKLRGECIGAYSYVRLKDGSDSFEVLGLEEVLSTRDRSQGFKSAMKFDNQDHPWIRDFREMAKKTAFRRHSKWLPLSPELREKIEIDDEEVKEINVTPSTPIKESFIDKLESATVVQKSDPVVKESLTPDSLFTLDPTEPDGPEKLRIMVGEFGMVQADIVKLMHKKGKAPKGATTFDELTDENQVWLAENMQALVEGK